MKSRKNLWQWHRWFAWHPIRIGKKIVWLEFVNRSQNCDSAPPWLGGSYWWEYRLED